MGAMVTIQLWIFVAFLGFARTQMSNDYIGICDQPWLPAYAHDYRGAGVLGSRSLLQNHIIKGYMVRVQFSTKEWAITFSADDFTFRGTHVCGGSTWILSDNGTHIDTDADWLPTLVCTNGEVNRINYTTASWIRDVGTPDLELDGEVWWFTKPTHSDNHPVYSQFVDGTTSYGSLKRLMKLAKWSELRANMRDRGFSFVIQNTKIYDDQLLTAQSLNQLSLKYTREAVKYNNDPYYKWASVWSTNGRRDIYRAYLTNSTLYKHNNDFVSIDWYGDQCWRRVYSTDMDGFPVYGSVDELIHLIKLGHRVRMHFDGFTLKANGIRVVDGLVVAQTIEEYARRGGYPSYEAPFFTTKAKAVYRLVHSTGMVKTYKYNIEDFQLSEMNQNKFAIDWLVDTREWRKVLRTDANGQATYGYKVDLEEAVATGASVRLDIEQDELAGQFFTEADNVRINFFYNEVYAQALKHVSDQKLQSVNEYILQSDVFRWSLMVSSNGVVAMNARRFASKLHLYDAVSPATNVTWFVNV